MDKEMIRRLRAIPVERVAEAFGLALPGPDEHDAAHRVRNGIDLLMWHARLGYDDCVAALADKFPEVLQDGGVMGTIAQKSLSERAREAGDDQEVKNIAYEVLRQLDAFGAPRYHVYAGNKELPDVRGYSSRIGFPGGMPVEMIIEKISYLRELNDKGLNIYVDPVYAEGDKIKVIVDDLHPREKNGEMGEDRFPPTMIIQTSRESRQAVYVVPRKYEKEFYDRVASDLNEAYGDPKVNRASTDTRLAGFRNMKRKHDDGQGNYPAVSVTYVDKTVPKAFCDWLDHVHPAWLRQVEELEAPDGGLPVDVAPLELEEVEVSPELEDLAARSREWIEALAPHRKHKNDIALSMELLNAGATADEAYTCLLAHSFSEGAKDLRRHCACVVSYAHALHESRREGLERDIERARAEKQCADMIAAGAPAAEAEERLFEVVGDRELARRTIEKLVERHKARLERAEAEIARAREAAAPQGAAEEERQEEAEHARL